MLKGNGDRSLQPRPGREPRPEESRAMKFTTSPRSRVAAALSFVLLAGCATGGLSPRETAQQNYSSFVYSLYDMPAPAGAREETSRTPARLVLPARVAVVQVGEVAPPQAFLAKLRGRPDLFSR